MNRLIFACAAGLLAATATAASAMPGTAAKGADVRAVSENVHTVADVDVVVRRDRHDRRWQNRRWRDRGIDWNDDRYRPYRGWHRYHHRPWGWRNRGCVSVGPIWFCK